MRKLLLYILLLLLPLSCYADLKFKDGVLEYLLFLGIVGFVSIHISGAAILAFIFYNRRYRKLHIINCIGATVSIIILMNFLDSDDIFKIPVAFIFPISLILSIRHLIVFYRRRKLPDNTEETVELDSKPPMTTMQHIGKFILFLVFLAIIVWLVTTSAYS